MRPIPGPPALRRSLLLGALAAAGAVSVRSLFRPTGQGGQVIVDWGAVGRIAGRRSGETDRLSGERRALLAGDYDRLAGQLAPLMADVCGTGEINRPPITAIDRHGFIEANVTIAQRLFVPLERLRAQLPDSRASVLTRSALNRYVGELFGLMSQRVLGQYDPVLMLPPAAGSPHPTASPSPPALFLVEPNVAAFERSQRADGTGLRRWLILHEMTHAWQFGNHPWLRDHVVTLLSDLLVEGLLSQASETRSPLQLAGRLPTVVRAQLRGMARIQAVMSLLEGYSNFVMHRVGRAHLEGFEDIEAAFERRRRQRSALERLLMVVTGLSLKLRQYGLGESFAEAVSERGGVALLNRVWEGPELLPTLDELRDPALWMARAG